jgi:MarR family transcriptional regulator for hemolysin
MAIPTRRRRSQAAAPTAAVPAQPAVPTAAPPRPLPPWAVDGSRAEPNTPLPPPLRLTIDLVLAARRWRALLDERLRPLGQSAARMEAMTVIARAPPDSAQIEIARRIGIEGATFTRMVDALEADSLVERRPHPTDRRTKHIGLTATGQSVLAELLALAAGLRERLLTGVAPDDVDATNLFLEGLLARMEDDLPQWIAAPDVKRI